MTKVVAIRTDFKHHGPNAGYKQILNYIDTLAVLGIDENIGASRFKQKYQWYYEFEAIFKFGRKADVLHVMYGEDYFRFSSIFFRKKVVASFHQPPELLRKEVETGAYRGRMAAVTHYFTRGRFKKLHAAIVMEGGQKEVLKSVMPEERIFVVPLGTYHDRLGKITNVEQKQKKVQVITVGQWLRNWDEYFKVVERCRSELPNLNFILVNRSLKEKYIQKCRDFPNLDYRNNVTDEELYTLYSTSIVQFLPVTSAAGNNAVLEGLSLGCPLLMTDVVSDEFPFKGEFVDLYEPGNVNQIMFHLRKYIGFSYQKHEDLKSRAIAFSFNFSWHAIAEKTKEIYELEL